jgi:electron transfer flavoprotein beta subunit
MNILVCIKRIAATGGRVTLTDDGRAIDDRYLSFTVSPHEECAIEEAVRLVEAHGGSSTVLTLGPEAAADQLRDALAVGIERAIHLVTEGDDWDPEATAAAIVDAIAADRAAGVDHQLLLFGNEAADSGDYQVAVRVAVALGLPWVTGLKSLEVREGTLLAGRDAVGGREIFELPLPAVVSVREGLNRPRYPSIPGRLRAKKKEILASHPVRQAGGLERLRYRLPDEASAERRATVLGSGPEAAPAVVDLLDSLGLL